MIATCPSCGAAVPAHDVNLERMLGKCERCSQIFDVSAQLPTPAGPQGPRRARRLVPIPTSIRVLEDARQETPTTYRVAGAVKPRVVLERRWRTPQVAFMVLWCIVWDGILVAWYAGVPYGAAAPIGAALLPLMHVAIGVFATYVTLCVLVNRTRIALEDGVLSVRHGPLPWPGALAIRADQLEQLFCREVAGRKDSGRYRLVMLLKSGQEKPLIRRMQRPEEALYLEQLLEERLGIIDAPVAGEYV